MEMRRWNTTAQTLLENENFVINSNSVVVGASKFSEVQKIEKIIINEGYDNNTVLNDIAVLQLERLIGLSNEKKAKIIKLSKHTLHTTSGSSFSFLIITRSIRRSS